MKIWWYFARVKQQLVLMMVVLTLGGCRMLGGGKNKMKENQRINSTSGGLAINVADNVNSELWRLHPALNYLKSELGGMALAQGLYQGGDSIVRADAALFWQEIEQEYMTYEPKSDVINALDSALRLRQEGMAGKPARITLLMIGGNWCSDTRMGLPRLCKVLDVLMASTDGNGVRNREVLEYAGVEISLDYRRVNRDKKLIDGALAGELFFGQRSVLISRVPEVCVAYAWKSSPSIGGNPDVDFAAEPLYVGSILETPQVSWEADFLELLRRR